MTNDLIQKMSLNAFRELRGGQVELTPSYSARKDSRPLMTIHLQQSRIITQAGYRDYSVTFTNHPPVTSH